MKNVKWYVSIVCVLLSIASIGQNKTKKIASKTKDNVEVTVPETESITLDSKKTKTLSVTAPELANWTVNGKQYAAKESDCVDIFGDYILEFNTDGRLVSNPPEHMIQNQTISARVNIEQEFWMNRKHEAIKNYITALENLNDLKEKLGDPSKKPVIYFGVTIPKVKELMAELAYRITSYVASSDLDNSYKSYYKNKVQSIVYQVVEVNTTYFPVIADFVVAKFTIKYKFYDQNGNRIDDKGKLFCCEESEPEVLKPCCSTVAGGGGYYLSIPKTIPPKTFEVKYDLRLKNPINEMLLTSANNEFPTALRKLLAQVKGTITPKYESAVSKIKGDTARLKLTKYPSSINTGGKPDQGKIAQRKKADDDIAEVDRRLAELEAPIDALITALNSNNANTEWLLKWQWLTFGSLEISPVASIREALFPDQVDPKKLSDQDKAKYQIFEMMVNKEAFQIDKMDEIESKLSKLSEIKAAIDQEAKKKTDTPYSDVFLYNGLLKTSPSDSSIFMRHHDVLTDFLVMGINPRKEVNERQRLFVLLENKTPDQKFQINITAAQITSDLPEFDTQLALSMENADKARPVIKYSEKNVKIICDRYKELLKNIKALKALSKPPVLPSILPVDPTPSYLTDVLEHNYFFEAPVNVNYSIKAIAADNTEKEVKQSTYRINKLYRFRFKAGLVYSFLKENDYTFTAPNQYTLSNPTYGIDGTFGVQVFFPRRDIRKNNIWTPYAFAGLSMRKVTENFYLGAGVEPLSGLAIGAVAHIGKREGLVGQNGIPTDITTTWGVHVGVTVLVDWVLFTKLFGFGNQNKALFGF